MCTAQSQEEESFDFVLEFMQKDAKAVLLLLRMGWYKIKEAGVISPFDDVSKQALVIGKDWGDWLQAEMMKGQ